MAISINFLLVLSKRGQLPKVNYLDILTNSPQFFYKIHIGIEKENLYFDMGGLKG